MAALTADITALAIQYGPYGYRRIAAMLGDQGWVVNVKRVERIWRREGLKVPARQPKRGRLWLNDGSCARLRAEHPNHVRFRSCKAAIGLDFRRRATPVLPRPRRAQST